jgi:hypothetical protein
MAKRNYGKYPIPKMLEENTKSTMPNLFRKTDKKSNK